MKKPPKIFTERDIVRKLGQDLVGIVREVSGTWIVVQWQGDKAGPKICHANELEQISQARAVLCDDLFKEFRAQKAWADAHPELFGNRDGVIL